MSEIINSLNPQSFFEDAKKYGAQNLEKLKVITDNNLLCPKEYETLSISFIDKMNQRFKGCFPAETFRNVIALNMIADYIPHDKTIDLENRWQEITSKLNLSLE